MNEFLSLWGDVEALVRDHGENEHIVLRRTSTTWIVQVNQEIEHMTVTHLANSGPTPADALRQIKGTLLWAAGRQEEAIRLYQEIPR